MATDLDHQMIYQVEMPSSMLQYMSVCRYTGALPGSFFIGVYCNLKKMGDPGFISGLIGVGIDLLIKQVILHINVAVRCRQELSVLQKLVEQIQPINLEIQQRRISLRQRDDHNNQTSSDLATPKAVNEWLKKLNGLLENASELVQECKIPRYNVISRYMLSKRISKTSRSIQEHLDKLPLVGLAHQLHQGEILRAELQRIGAGDDRVASSSNEPPPKGLPPVQEPLIVGQDELSIKVVGLLIDESSATSRVGVAGMGGVGKTLLLKTALNSKEVQQHFQNDLVLWLTVSHNLSVLSLRNNLGRQIALHTKESFSQRWSDSEAQQWIFERMSARRFVLFLDDVWEESDTLLRMLGVPDELDMKYSKIVVSTRNRSVLAKLKVREENKIDMDYLSPEDSWRLFRSHAFGDRPQNVPPAGIEEIAMRVCAECDRLPLAIKVIGASMAGSVAPADWRVALQRLQNADKLNADVEKKLYNRLRLSYDALCDDPNLIILQLCFLYIGAFKEDEDMYMDDVINLWIGEGLLPSQHSLDPLEVGRSYANRLLDRCLIEASIKDADGQVVACSMHDVLHDLALGIAEDEENCCFRAGKALQQFPLEECRGRGRISLMENKFSSIPDNFRAPDLRAMLLSENINLRSLPESVFASLKSIRVLDLGGTSIQSLPENLGQLKHLVCLRLARVPVKELPESVTLLKELRILDLSYCSNLAQLPHGLHKMTSLMYLDLTFCQGLQCLPLGASSLPSLQYLKMEKCWKAWQSSAVQHPSARMGICGGSDTRHPACSLKDLRSLIQLKWLSLEDWGQPIPNGTMGSMLQMRTLILRMLQMQELPEDMSQMSELSTLLLHCPFLVRIPNWICDFERLTCFVLSKCDKVKELPALQKLQCLRRLDIVGCWLLRELPDAFGEKQAFPRLESFWLEQTRELKVLPALMEGAMPSLKRLGLVVCENVRRLPQGFQNLKNLREMHIYSSSLLRNSVEPGGVDYDLASRLEQYQRLEILKEPVQETHLKQMEKRMGNKYWWDRLLKDLWMNFHII